ncbi:MAG: hypothetical protein AAFV88_09240 [Planctomycetota bacterium]
MASVNGEDTRRLSSQSDACADILELISRARSLQERRYSYSEVEIHRSIQRLEQTVRRLDKNMRQNNQAVSSLSKKVAQQDRATRASNEHLALDS